MADAEEGVMVRRGPAGIVGRGGTAAASDSPWEPGGAGLDGHGQGLPRGGAGASFGTRCRGARGRCALHCASESGPAELRHVGAGPLQGAQPDRGPRRARADLGKGAGRFAGRGEPGRA